jgi:hypothetical protein
MGAVPFFTHASGDTAEDAFADCKQALHQQYEDTDGVFFIGQVWEKPDVILFDVIEEIEREDYDALTTPEQMADILVYEDGRIQDKWGPAGAIDLGVHEGRRWFMIFGWANS